MVLVSIEGGKHMLWDGQGLHGVSCRIELRLYIGGWSVHTVCRIGDAKYIFGAHIGRDNFG